MDIATVIIQLVTALLVFQTVDVYEISTRHVTWNEIDDVCKQHFLPELFTEEVKDGLTNLLPSNEKFWLRAKSRPTNYLIWKGCHGIYLDKKVRPTKLENNSISSCIRITNCTAVSTLVLKGETCICMPGSDRSEKFSFTPQYELNQTCPGNLNEDCGCSNNIYSVYVLTRKTRGEGDCFTKSETNSPNRPIETGRNCDDKVAMDYRCQNGKYSNIYRAGAKINWLEARQLCHDNGIEIGGDVPDKQHTSTGGGEYWTSERSSFELMWTGLSDDSDKQCVAVIKDGSGVLQLSENNCSSSFRAVCTRAGQSADSRFPALIVIIAVVGGAATLGVLILGAVCWKRRNRYRKRSSTVNNRFYDQVVSSNVPTRQPAQPERGQASNQGQSTNAYQSVDLVVDNNTTSDEGHYDVTFTHTENDLTLPVATGNIYDRCYGKSTGTPIDGTTSNNTESEKVVSASTKTDAYDTTRNVLSKGGAKLSNEGDYASVNKANSSNKEA